MKGGDEGHGYDKADIKVLEGLAPVRKRPGADEYARRAEYLEKRRAAMDEQAHRYDELRALHAAIAARLANPTTNDARALLDRAERQIATWERGGTCSPVYVRVWRRILRDPAARLDRYIVRGHYGSAEALMQNSPFGFLLTRYRAGELG